MKSGRPMRYAGLILTLEDKKLYSLDGIRQHGIKTRFLSKAAFIDDDAGEARRRAFDALSKFRKKYIQESAHGQAPNKDGVKLDAWYGWRWKLALPLRYREPKDTALWKTFKLEHESRSHLQDIGDHRCTGCMAKQSKGAVARPVARGHKLVALALCIIGLCLIAGM